MFNNKVIKMMIFKDIKKTYIFFFSMFFCFTLNAQSSKIELQKNEENLLITYKNKTILLKGILNPKTNAQFFKGIGTEFYITYEYYASFNKSNIIYSLCLDKNNIKVNQVVHFNFNDREGIPYGWIYYCNKSFPFNKINYDTLTYIKSQLDYGSFNKNHDQCIVEIHNNSGQRTALSKAIRKDDSIIIKMPLIYQGKTFFGEGTFKYKSKDWSFLCMNFPVDLLQSNFYNTLEPLSTKNVRSLNDIAFYLQKDGNYTESISVLKKVLQSFPNRIVAYINIGDSYWRLNEFAKAKKAYKRYYTLMKESGKETRIPKRVSERIK